MPQRRGVTDLHLGRRHQSLVPDDLDDRISSHGQGMDGSLTNQVSPGLHRIADLRADIGRRLEVVRIDELHTGPVGDHGTHVHRINRCSPAVANTAKHRVVLAATRGLVRWRLIPRERGYSLRRIRPDPDVRAVPPWAIRWNEP